MGSSGPGGSPGRPDLRCRRRPGLPLHQMHSLGPPRGPCPCRAAAPCGPQSSIGHGAFAFPDYGSSKPRIGYSEKCQLHHLSSCPTPWPSSIPFFCISALLAAIALGIGIASACVVPKKKPTVKVLEWRRVRQSGNRVIECDWLGATWGSIRAPGFDDRPPTMSMSPPGFLGGPPQAFLGGGATHAHLASHQCLFSCPVLKG